ncbi:hypothetical protein LEP1GSC075_1219 [Leptospira interrogans str. Kito]|nr:hypothetical protein LEP1GSC069_1859 [Leptospira interrogans serovar Canicola str. Fiocruz LV133]EMK21088.1 hypothetical protein LEP1GSC075_1219 [Leptospira interrogans str. Kito]EMN74949.1 hypothetical protein LEP1GSC102_0093 [Leptospira interrogans str. UI 09600]
MNLQPIGVLDSTFIHSNKMFFLFLDGIWCSFLKLKKYSIF